MNSESRILKLLRDVNSSGILQSEISRKLGISKSTVSDVLASLEERRLIVRKKVSSRAYRVWCVEHSPEPVRGVLRVGILKASEYPKIISAARKLGAIIRVYDNSLSLTKDLVHEQIDVAASPLVTQIFFGVLMKNIKIFRIVAMNGSGIAFANSRGRVFGCSEFSTMERNLRKYMRIKGLSECIRYFSSPEKMLQSLNELRGVAIWEPYLTYLSDKEVERFENVLGNFVCCTLAANNRFLTINWDIFEEFLEKLDRASYGSEEARFLAELIGFDEKVIRKSFCNYIFDVDNELIFKEVAELGFERFGSISEIICIN